MNGCTRSQRFRLGLIFILFASLFALIAIRLYYLQVMHHTFFTHRAESQYRHEVCTTNPRTAIVDRTGAPLAFDRRVHSAFIHPAACYNDEATLAFLRDEYPDAYQAVITNPTKKFLWLERRMNDKQAALLAAHNLPHVHIVNEIKRFYPYPCCGHVVGYTDIDNHGIAGVELSVDDYLKAEHSHRVLYTDARSKHFYFEKIADMQHGSKNAVQLTLDHTLQFLAQQELVKRVDALNARGGAVVIMNPESGEILSMAHAPAFDPNAMTQASIADSKNIAVTESYELGSIVKIFSALAALDAGVTTLDEPIDCEGKKYMMGNFKVENWKPLGILPFKEVVRQSSNVGIAKVVTRLGSDLFAYFQRLGLGQPTGITFPGERAGFINPPHRWSKYSPIALSFGYEIMGTLLQVARAVSIIANGGFAVKPRLIMHDNQDTQRKRLFDKSTIEAMHEIMRSPHTIFPSILKKTPLTGYEYFGKTGTARCLVDGTYSRTRHVYTFAGFIRKGDYKRVIVTFIKEPDKPNLWASQVTAPLFVRVAERMVVHDAISCTPL